MSFAIKTCTRHNLATPFGRLHKSQFVARSRTRRTAAVTGQLTEMAEAIICNYVGKVAASENGNFPYINCSRLPRQPGQKAAREAELQLLPVRTPDCPSGLLSLCVCVALSFGSLVCGLLPANKSLGPGAPLTLATFSATFVSLSPSCFGLSLTGFWSPPPPPPLR